MIILQDVMRDVINFETERPKGRSAAQNHFLCLLALGIHHGNATRQVLEVTQTLAKVGIWTDIQTSILDDIRHSTRNPDWTRLQCFNC